MKIFIFIICVFIIQNNDLLSKDKIRIKDVDSILIGYVSFSLRREDKQDCNDFGWTKTELIKDTCDKGFKKVLIKNKDKFNRLISLINKTKYIKYSDTDVKLKVLFFKRKKVIHELCFSTYVILLDGKAISFDKELINELIVLSDYEKLFGHRPLFY